MTTWDDLAAAALLGTRRRAVDVTALPGPLGEAAAALDAGDPAAALLDAAALAVPYRRAGRRVATFDGTLPEPAPADESPPASVAAGARLADLLVNPYRPANQTLVREWLTLAGARGLRVPPETLPALLESASRSAALAHAVEPVLGERGRWLARARPEWAALVAVEAPDGAPEETWRTGSTEARHALFARLRRTDPATARDLLTSTWKTEKGEDRERFVEAMLAGLSAADEAFLEAALDDRRRDVRDAAAVALARLPGSEYVARMAARVAAAARTERRLLRTRLVVTPPPPDAAAVRDRLGDKPPQGVGAQAWLLRGLASRAPLRAWEDATGLTPDQLLATNVEGGWRPELVAGWFAAVTREGDARWARALVAAEGLPDGDAARDVLRVLPAAERSALALAELRSPTGRVGLTRLLGAFATPWPRELVEGVLRFLAKPPGMPEQHPDLSSHLATHLPPATATAVFALADARPPEDRWRAALLRLVDTLSFRHDMHEELR